MAKGTIVVSLRSKGLPSFNSALIFDFRYQAVQLATELVDVFLAGAVSISCLSWSAWISIAIIIVSIAGTQQTDFATSSGDVIFVIYMYVVLPILLLLVFVFTRRDRALRSLSNLKAAFVTLTLSRPVGTTEAQREASNDLYRRAAAFIEDLRQYLQHRRPYARHFYLPYRAAVPSPNDQLLKVSRELGLFLRKVHRGVRDLHLTCARIRETGVSEAKVDSLVNKVEAVHAATEQLISIKEMRTPVVLRAMVRWFVIVVIPVAMGPFWNQFTATHNMRAYSGIIGVLTHIALLGILDTVVAMEDPFDDTALDAISLFEMVDQVAVMTTPVGDGDGYDTEGLGTIRDVGDANGGPSAHVAMFVGGSDGRDDNAAAERAAAAMQGTASSGAGSPGEPSTVGPLEPSNVGQRQGNAGLAQPTGVPAMRASTVTSETAVGPPSAMDPYGGGGGVPSITSPPLADVGGPVRSHAPMPPMPGLAGNPAYRAVVQ